MDLSQVAVATITWPRTTEEEELLARSLTRLAEAGLPVAVADRGTSAAFSQRLKPLPGFRVTTPAKPGLVPQVQSCIALAATFRTPFILYVESDKELFFENRLRDFIRQAADHNDVGVVLASRSDKSFQTFPEVQRHTEGIANYLCGRRLGCPGDFFYGPFLMSRTLLSHISNLEARLGWGWRPSTFVDAHRRGLRLVHVIDDHCCPPNQQNENDAEQIHRIRQLSENMLGLIE
jgi:hypothetical protein